MVMEFLATYTANATGNITVFSITNSGSGYKQGDVLRLVSGNFQYTLSAPVYNGVISSIIFQSDGSGYLKK